MCKPLAPRLSVVVLRKSAILEASEERGGWERRSLRRVVLLRRQDSKRSSFGVAPSSDIVVAWERCVAGARRYCLVRWRESRAGEEALSTVQIRWFEELEGWGVFSRRRQLYVVGGCRKSRLWMWHGHHQPEDETDCGHETGEWEWGTWAAVICVASPKLREALSFRFHMQI